MPPYHTRVSMLLGALLLLLPMGNAQLSPAALGKLTQTLETLRGLAPFPCDDANTDHVDDRGAIERAVIDQVIDISLEQLNVSPQSSLASERADLIKVLQQTERAADASNANWPVENRLHFKVQEIAPLLAVTVTLRSNDVLLIFGFLKDSGDKTLHGQWVLSPWSDEQNEDFIPWIRIEVFPLHRGPSGLARFLVSRNECGCGGSSGIDYRLLEWKDDSGYLETELSQTGAFGMDMIPEGDRPSWNKDFRVVGKLLTQGSLITLPYCSFTAIDFWDNPNLCTVDAYDVSGDHVRFVSRRYNRPDLAPISKAIEYAQKHDYLAVRAFCANERVAKIILRSVSDTEISEESTVIRSSRGRERIQLAQGEYFDVERRKGGWVITGVHGRE